MLFYSVWIFLIESRFTASFSASENNDIDATGSELTSTHMLCASEKQSKSLNHIK